MLKGVTLYLLSFLLAHAEIELVGINSSSDGIFVLLSDSVTNSTSGWITQGDTFKGYTVLEFDKATSVLNIKKGSESLRLRLRDSRVADVRDSFPGISRERALESLGWKYRNADVVLRAIAEVKDGRLLYTCVEVWKSGSSAVSSGDVIVGPAVSIHPEFQILEKLLFYKGDPLKKITFMGVTPCSGGKLGICPVLSLDELREFLTKQTANQLPDPTSPSVTPPAGAGVAPSVAADH
jgi:hypothetical protein